MRSFSDIYALACVHKDGEAVVERSLPVARSKQELLAVSNAEYLSTMCRRIFRAGLKHSLVDKKWPYFEKAFNGFDSMFCAMLSDEDIDVYMSDKNLIRHLGKIKAIRTNAQFMYEVTQEHGSFGQFLLEWNESNIVELWLTLKKRGAHLGGSSGAQFLRMVGKDTFCLTRDVVGVLKLEGVVEKEPTSQKDLKAVGDAFFQWHKESGRPLCEISRIVSFVAL